MISVVVPIYNVEGYIEECLRSILKQTYKDLEILCIDDCTLDNSMAIVRKYAQKDNRIKIIVHKENRGLGGARNTGIIHAKGEYICFIDSDDYIEPTMLEEMHTAITTHDVDAVVCGVRRFSGSNTLAIESGFHYLKNCRSGIYDIQNSKLELINMWPSAWNKLYITNRIRKHQCCFPERLLYEDHFFYYNYFFNIRKFYYVNKPFYCYRAAREGSITSGITGREKEVYKVLHSLKEIFNNNMSMDEAKKCYARIAFRLIWERQSLFWNNTSAWLDFCKDAKVFLNEEFELDYLAVYVDTLIDRMDPFYRYIFTQGLKKELFILKLKIKNYRLAIMAKHLRDRIRAYKTSKMMMREILWLSWNNKDKLQELSWVIWNTHDKISETINKETTVEDEKEFVDEEGIAV